MQVIANSGVLYALSLTLLNSIWQSGLLWLLYLFITRIIKLTSHIKYWIAVLLQLISCIIFIFSVAANTISKKAFFYGFNASQSNTIFLPTNTSNISQILPLLALLYLLLTSFFLLKLIYTYQFSLKIYRRHLIEIDERWLNFIANYIKKWNIQSTIKIFASVEVDSPLTFGILKPIIIVPLASINYLSTEQMEAVLLHELSHIKRADYFINLLLVLIETILFFNPFNQLISKIILQERESACDDVVLSFSYSPITYAEALFQLAANSVRKDSLQLSMKAINNNTYLLKRIARITGTYQYKSDFSYLKSIKIIALLLISISTAFLTFFNFTSTNNNNQKSTQLISSIKENKNNVAIKNSYSKKFENNSRIIHSKKHFSHTTKYTITDNDLNAIVATLNSFPIEQVNYTSIESNLKNKINRTTYSLSSKNLKEKIKKYLSKKNISVADFKDKIDSLKTMLQKQQLLVHFAAFTKNNAVILPSIYIEKDLNESTDSTNVSSNDTTATKASSQLYMIINLKTENKDSAYLIIPLKRTLYPSSAD